MFDRFMAMGENSQILEQMHARNWLLHRFNSAAGNHNPTTTTGNHYTLPYGSMNLPQAQADQNENVG